MPHPPTRLDPDLDLNGKPRAIESTGLSRTLRRSRARAVGMVVVSAIVGLIAAGTYGSLEQHYLDEQQQLPRYPGRIIEVRDTDSEGTGGEVVVRWEQDGARWRGTVHVGNTGSWDEGQSVHVIRDPARPKFATLPGENYKPEGFDVLFGLIGFVCLGVLVGGSVQWVRTNRKLRRVRTSSWRSVDAQFVVSRGENGEKTIVYVPEYSTDQLWLVRGCIPGPTTRVQIAGERRGLVMRLGHGSPLMLAEPLRLLAPVTARVSASDEHGGEVALRLDAGTQTYVVSGQRSRLAPDVGDLATVRAATVRLGPYGIVALQLGLSKRPTFFTRLADSKARKQWPELVAPK